MKASESPASPCRNSPSVFGRSFREPDIENKQGHREREHRVRQGFEPAYRNEPGRLRGLGSTSAPLPGGRAVANLDHPSPEESSGQLLAVSPSRGPAVAAGAFCTAAGTFGRVRWALARGRAVCSSPGLPLIFLIVMRNVRPRPGNALDIQRSLQQSAVSDRTMPMLRFIVLLVATCAPYVHRRAAHGRQDAAPASAGAATEATPVQAPTSPGATPPKAPATSETPQSDAEPAAEADAQEAAVPKDKTIKAFAATDAGRRNQDTRRRSRRKPTDAELREDPEQLEACGSRSPGQRGPIGPEAPGCARAGWRSSAHRCRTARRKRAPMLPPNGSALRRRPSRSTDGSSGRTFCSCAQIS